MRSRLIVAAALLVTMLPASASIITMHSSSAGITAGAGGEGGGRGIGFRADSTFSVDSAGIFFDLVSQSYDVQVYASTDGNSAGGVLASASAVVGGGGAAFYDIAINFTFNAGSFYVLHWRPTDLGLGDWLAGSTPNGYFSDGALPEVSGPVTLINGVEGTTPTSFTNSLHPNLRMNMVMGVDEPGVLALLVLGLAGLRIAGQRKRSA